MDKPYGWGKERQGSNVRKDTIPSSISNRSSIKFCIDVFLSNPEIFFKE
jgi:hypothetical protein